jgi:hypothetical protein
MWFYYENLRQFPLTYADHPFDRDYFVEEEKLDHKGISLEAGPLEVEVKIFSRWRETKLITENYRIQRVDDRKVTVVRVQ